MMYAIAFTVSKSAGAAYRRSKPAMKRTTVFADNALLLDLKRVSEQEKKSLAQVMREAFEAHVARKRVQSDRFSFTGKYDSGRRDIAEKHEELLWTKRP